MTQKSVLYEYVIIFHQLQTKEQRDNGEAAISKLLTPEPKRILAKDDKAANVMASRDIPEAYLDKLDQVEVVIRPF
jgi:hypothetical protein